jgi:hypothetical protein
MGFVHECYFITSKICFLETGNLDDLFMVRAYWGPCLRAGSG